MRKVSEKNQFGVIIEQPPRFVKKSNLDSNLDVYSVTIPQPPIMFQETYLKYIFKVYLLCLTMTGLWPFTYNSKNKSFTLNILYAIIPLVLVPFYCITNFLEFSLLLNEVKVVFRNIVLKMVSNVYFASNLIISVYIYATQYYQYRRIKKLFHKIRILLTNIDEWLTLRNVNFLPELFKFTLKSFIFTLIFEVYHITSVSFVAPNTFGVTTILAFVLPNFIIKFYPDIFYGGMLVIHFYFHEMNKELRHIANIIVDGNSSKNHELQRNLNNKVENLAIHYFHLIEVVKEFNSITSFRVVLWLCISVWNFIIHLFMQYVFIGIPIRYGHTLNMVISIFGFIDIIIQFFEFSFTTSICTKVINEINVTEKMLCSMYINFRHNDQFDSKVNLVLFIRIICHLIFDDFRFTPHS